MIIFLFVLVGIGLIFRYLIFQSKPSHLGNLPVAEIDRTFLEKEVLFYRNLNTEERDYFVLEAKRFLSRTRIIGVDTEITDDIRILIASSAVIPVFYFKEWDDYPLEEVLVYPAAINFDFETNVHDSNILGMVGTGQMEGKMALSKHALLEGFQNKTDKHNTAIHEFVHLIDKLDGRIDGIPEVLLDKPYVLPWLELMRKHIHSIKQGDSDIHEYGATNLAEFLAVSSEYFFERPELLKVKNPELYKYLDRMFRPGAESDTKA